MNTQTKLILVAMVLALFAGAAGAQGMALAPGDAAPALLAWDLEGKLQPLEWKGITLVNFWATWCKPCREEMPVLQELHDEYAGDEFRIIGMTKDHDVAIEVVQEFLDELQVNYPVYKSDKNAVWDFVRVVPTSFLIDGDGKIIRKYVGATAAQIAGLRQDVENLLAGRPMEPLVLPEPDSN